MATCYFYNAVTGETTYRAPTNPTRDGFPVHIVKREELTKVTILLTLAWDARREQKYTTLARRVARIFWWGGGANFSKLTFMFLISFLSIVLIWFVIILCCSIQLLRQQSNSAPKGAREKLDVFCQRIELLNWHLFKVKKSDPDVTRTRNLPIWSRMRYHCATESIYASRFQAINCKLKNTKVFDWINERGIRNKSKCSIMF